MIVKLGIQRIRQVMARPSDVSLLLFWSILSACLSWAWAFIIVTTRSLIRLRSEAVRMVKVTSMTARLCANNCSRKKRFRMTIVCTVRKHSEVHTSA